MTFFFLHEPVSDLLLDTSSQSGFGGSASWILPRSERGQVENMSFTASTHTRAHKGREEQVFACAGQSTTLWTWVSLSTFLWVSETELRSRVLLGKHLYD